VTLPSESPYGRLLAGRAQAAVVAVVVCLTAAIWSLLALRLDVPTVFGDELVYWDASRSLAAGDGLAVRGGTYDFGPLYPALLAPVHLLADGDLEAYRWARVLGALLFSLAAVPVFLLARRLVAPGVALVCAALAVTIPSALYTGFVMTEAAAYPAACLAFLAVVAAAESPTVTRQLLALGAISLATGIRLQLAVLGVALVVVLVLQPFVTGGRRPGRAALRRLWPVGAVVAIALVVGIAKVVSGNPLAGYAGLWQSYDASEIARWSWRALGGLAFYLALVPFVVAPAALRTLAREGRSGRATAAALLTLTCSVTVVLVLVVGAFSSTTYGVGFLHDRYLFYVAPLWVIVLAVWTERREATERGPLAVGAFLTVALVATLPPFLLAKDGGRLFDAVASALPGEIANRAGRGEPAKVMLLAAVVVGVALVALVPVRLRPLLLALVGAAFLAGGAIAWDTRIASAQNTTFPSLTEDAVAWVDAALPDGVSAALLAGGVPVEERDALRLTEFFNGSIGPAYDLAGALAPTLDSEPVRLVAGAVVDERGRPVSARYVVAPHDLRLEGEVIATGTRYGVALWRVEGPLRVLAGGS
jgi:Dolichyl-phosphate-mannose-protein mannosyltransferase